MDMIRENIKNTIERVEKELENTRYWIEKMDSNGIDVQQQKLKQMREEARLNQLRNLL